MEAERITNTMHIAQKIILLENEAAPYIPKNYAEAKIQNTYPLTTATIAVRQATI
jgi:hypothetical protein